MKWFLIWQFIFVPRWKMLKQRYWRYTLYCTFLPVQVQTQPWSGTSEIHTLFLHILWFHSQVRKKMNNRTSHTKNWCAIIVTGNVSHHVTLTVVPIRINQSTIFSICFFFSLGLIMETMIYWKCHPCKSGLSACGWTPKTTNMCPYLNKRETLWMIRVHICTSSTDTLSLFTMRLKLFCNGGKFLSKLNVYKPAITAAHHCWPLL